jgi:large subunit ribosomal protein L30e|tara:strand:- start:411 stop:704 length:294 start_codon:yes stop_codon:yes gene_type:complete
MVKKQVIDKEVKEIKKLLKSKNLIIGTKRTMKYLKLGKISRIYLSSNCKDAVKSDLEYYNKISPVKIIKLKYPNDELGVLCKKPFFISVLSLLKGGK